MNSFTLLRAYFPLMILIMLLCMLGFAHSENITRSRVLRLGMEEVVVFGLGAFVLRFILLRRPLKDKAWALVFLLWFGGSLLRHRGHTPSVTKEFPSVALSFVPFAGPLIVAKNVITEFGRKAAWATMGDSFEPRRLDAAIDASRPYLVGLVLAFMAGLLRLPQHDPELYGMSFMDSLKRTMPPGQPRQQPDDWVMDENTTVTLITVPVQSRVQAAKSTPAAAPLPAVAPSPVEPPATPQRAVAPAQPQGAGGHQEAPGQLWYVLENDRIQGPFPLAELTMRQQGGSLPPHTRIRRKGTGNWLLLREASSQGISSST